MANDCKLLTKNKVELEIRQHKALLKATEATDSIAFLLYFGAGFDETLRQTIMNALN